MTTMTPIVNCPFGVEDGHIVAYRASESRLEVDYEFWNEKRGTILFDDFFGVHDNTAIGITVGALVEKTSSDLLTHLIGRSYVVAPADLNWRHFQFLDVDDQAIFEVVAISASFLRQ
jgi:hypothetical protein